MSMMYDREVDDFDWSFTSKPALPSKTKAVFEDKKLMKNKDQINHLEDHIEVLINRINYLEQRIARLEAKNVTFGPGGMGAPPAPAWPGFSPKPTWDPNIVPYTTTCRHAGSPTIQ